MVKKGYLKNKKNKTPKLLLLSILFNKGVNLVPEAVPVWLAKQYISVPVNIGVPFRVYRYLKIYILFIYIFKINK